MNEKTNKNSCNRLGSTHTHTHTSTLLENSFKKETFLKRKNNQGSLTITAIFTVLIFSLYGIMLYARSASSYIRQTKSIETIQAIYAQDVPNAARIAEQLGATPEVDYQGEATMIARDNSKGFWQTDYINKITSIEFKHGDTTVPEGAIDLGNIATDTENSEIRVYVQDDGTGNDTYKCTVISLAKIYANENANNYFYNFINVEVIKFENFNTQNVVNMTNIFYNCKKLLIINLEGFDTHRTVIMTNMFYNCSSLMGINLTNFNTSAVMSMANMFYGCSSLKSIDVSKFDTSEVTAVNGLFSGCSSLECIDVSKFDTSKISAMNAMFNGCKKLRFIDISNFNTSNVTNMNYMFYNCSDLETIFTSRMFTTEHVTSSDSMFARSTKLVGGNGTTYNSEITDVTYARIDTQETPGYFTLKN